MLKILLTCVGRRVELIKAFRTASEKLGEKLVIYGTDFSPTAPALAFCDKKIKAKRISDPLYIEELLGICEAEDIRLVIPTIDTDLLLLAQNKQAFEAVGTKVLVSEPDKVAICRDKRKTAEFFLSCGLSSPLPTDDYTAYKMGYPAFIKPLDGSSSINAFRIENDEELEARAKSIDGYIIQPFIAGREYTIDVFCDFDGNPILITPRERTAVRSGEVLQTQIFLDDVMIDEAKRLASKYKPVGQITVQLIKDEKTGVNQYIEINPRFGGGSPLSIKAGADSAEMVLRLLRGEVLQYQDKVASNKAIFSRFDDSVCVDFGEKPNVSAVIFDLDDTLYSEKDYVKSGFLAVEQETGVSANALWGAFLAGLPALDTVLKELGRLDEKEKCLTVYRKHKPMIKPYDGVLSLIERLKSRGVFVGIITDGRPLGQRLKLEALGLSVDCVIVTDELGGEIFRKPCDIAFRMMRQHAKTDFAQMVYVADNPRKDFSAPTSLGMQCVYFDNKEGLYRQENNTTLPRITNIAELEGKL